MMSWLYRQADLIFRYGRRQYLAFDYNHYINKAECLLEKIDDQFPSWSDIRKSQFVRLLTGERGHALKVLGLEYSASEQDIMTAYRKLVKECHPDMSPTKESLDKFRAIQTAKDTLV